MTELIPQVSRRKKKDAFLKPNTQVNWLNCFHELVFFIFRFLKLIDYFPAWSQFSFPPSTFPPPSTPPSSSSEKEVLTVISHAQSSPFRTLILAVSGQGPFSFKPPWYSSLYVFLSLLLLSPFASSLASDETPSLSFLINNRSIVKKQIVSLR